MRPPNKTRKPAPRAWIGKVVIAIGVALAAFSAPGALKAAEENILHALLPVGGLVLASSGIAFVIHARRRQTGCPLSADRMY